MTHSHLEYVTALCDRLKELDGKSVSAPGSSSVTTRSYDGSRMDPEFVDQMARELARKMRREGML